MHKTKVSRAVAELERRRWLTRTPDENDRRVEHLALTKAGLAAYREMVPLAKAFERELLAKLSVSERERSRRTGRAGGSLGQKSWGRSAQKDTRAPLYSAPTSPSPPCRTAAAHRLEAGLEVVDADAVGDQPGNIEPALQQRDHLVPGLEHLAAVDALERQALEDDLVPVDRDARRAGCRASRSCRRGSSRRACRGTPRRCRTSPARRRSPRSCRGRCITSSSFSRATLTARGRAHLARQLEPVVVDVGDHDVARADVPRDRRGHDADRARRR